MNLKESLLNCIKSLTPAFNAKVYEHHPELEIQEIMAEQKYVFAFEPVFSMCPEAMPYPVIYLPDDHGSYEQNKECVQNAILKARETLNTAKHDGPA